MPRIHSCIARGSNLTPSFRDYSAREHERLSRLPPSPLAELDIDDANKFPDTIMVICCNILGDMILGCDTPLDMQHRFPDLIGPTALSLEDRAEILAFDEEMGFAVAGIRTSADLMQRVLNPPEGQVHYQNAREFPRT